MASRSEGSAEVATAETAATAGLFYCLCVCTWPSRPLCLSVYSLPLGALVSRAADQLDTCADGILQLVPVRALLERALADGAYAGLL